MAKTAQPGGEAAEIFAEMLRVRAEASRKLLETFAPPQGAGKSGVAAIEAMGEAMRDLQRNWLQQEMPDDAPPASFMVDPASWLEAMRGLAATNPMLDPASQQRLWADGMALWQQVLGQYEANPAGDAVALPRKDARFKDPAWRSQPVYALIHQTYLLFAERLAESVDSASGLSEEDRAKLRFSTKGVLDALSPANFPLMNPVVLERTLETGGENLLRGLERLSGDLERGQLTHTDTSKFTLGENIAATPGKVIYRTDLFEIIQYSPVTRQVLATPLVIFPPWINRFYILDLNAKKSFVRWAVAQGVTVCMVSWKSADESLAHVGWDDYFRTQIEVIDVVRERLQVPAVHAIGYCVGGTTLAGTLAVLARRGQADRVKSATFFTAQVDFADAGDLKIFVDQSKLELIRQASQGGYLDGRYLAATFNMLRGGDLIWNYVVNHYLLGEDYPAFDLLYWNGDVTNLPAKWHAAYLRDLYKDNLLVVPDALSADGTPIDLKLVETPSYIQAGREDHIAPPESVFKALDHFAGPCRFVLAGSGHIAGVVNPPEAGKYQYWTNSGAFSSLEEFIAGAQEHGGSWWPDWLEWLVAQDPARVPATGRRKPGGKGNRAIEDAPGRYVRMR